MARYESRLNAVLNERQIRQEQVERELAVERQGLSREEETLQKMIEASDTALKGLRERQQGPGLPGEIEIYYQFVSHQANRIKKQEEVVLAQRQIFEAKRQELEAVIRDKKMIEKIEEKRREVFLATLKKKESDFLDEVGSRMERGGLR